ncbi:hypothetical protein PTKIN_Ptkin01aG0378600 [Pterospermum kingtungense]
METTEISKDNSIISTPQDEDHEVLSWDDELQELIQTLPKGKHWYGHHLYFYQQFWCPSPLFKAVVSFQKHIQALDSDIIVTGLPKCGTTWLKALTFSIVNRNQFAKEENPLLSLGPHQLVRAFEFDLYLNNPLPDLENTIYPYNQPILFSTHIPYASLPPSIKESKAKIVHIGFWKASQENPNKILFLQYEDLKEDIISNLKKLAMFLGFPFSEEEEKQGVVEEIAELCGCGSLKELDVNKNGVHVYGIPHNTFFRKAKVGDWTNYLTPTMVERLKKLIQENLDNSGLTFKLS